MLIACWSAKGGNGTTVVAVALALMLAERSGATLVDLAGDVPAVLGLPEPSGPGVLDWCDSGASADALARLAAPAGRGLQVVAAGTGRDEGRGESGRDGPSDLDGALATLASPDRSVIVDCGTVGRTGLGLSVAAGAALSLLVTRPCYLSLRRALAAPIRPSAAVVVAEPGRSLGPGDVSEVLGVPVTAVVPFDPAVARAVDSGLLATRVPRGLRRALRRAA